MLDPKQVNEELENQTQLPSVIVNKVKRAMREKFYESNIEDINLDLLVELAETICKSKDVTYEQKREFIKEIVNFKRIIMTNWETEYHLMLNDELGNNDIIWNAVK
jgi:hypothetical protein